MAVLIPIHRQLHLCQRRRAAFCWRLARAMADNAQSIYGDAKRKRFSFKRAGIQAQGRTTILRVNYRNTDEILRFARDVARSILEPAEADDDGVPLIQPQSAGRDGVVPQIVKLPTLRAEAEFVARRLKEAHRDGTPWRDMAVIYRHYDPVGQTVLGTLRGLGVPVTWAEASQWRGRTCGTRQ